MMDVLIAKEILTELKVSNYLAFLRITLGMEGIHDEKTKRKYVENAFNEINRIRGIPNTNEGKGKEI